MMYTVCEDCGAHLDHGEKCDCGNAHRELDEKNGAAVGILAGRAV